MKVAIKLDGLLRLTRLDKFALTSENLCTASWLSCCEMIDVTDQSILILTTLLEQEKLFTTLQRLFN